MLIVRTMKTNYRIIHRLALLTLATLNPQLSTVFAQTGTFTNVFVPGQDIVVSGAVVTTAGVAAYNSLTVINNGKVLIAGSCTMTISNALTVEAGSSISADAQGYPGHPDGNGSGPGGGPQNWGGTYGGFGGLSAGSTPPARYGSVTMPTDLGSGGGGNDLLGGGMGGAGGGAIRLVVSGTLTLNGAITANGQSMNTGRGDGAGSGGSVYVTAGTLAGSGRFGADGGSSISNRGGGGGGGRVAVYYASGNAFTGYVSSTANGGTGAWVGGSGTVVFFDTSLPNLGVFVYQNTQWDQTNLMHYGSVTVTNHATLTLASGTTLEVDGTLSVLGNSTLLCPAINTTGQVSNQWAGVGVTINAPNVMVAAGSSISADGQGYAGGAPNTKGSGPGGGLNGIYNGGGGGYGGAGAGSLGGASYGSLMTPTDLGSGGGGNDSQAAGNGGGAIRLNVSQTLTLDGAITANGGNGGAGANPVGGGSGGSLYLTVNNLIGSGSLSANGGATIGGGDAGGGGGRIAVYFTTLTLPTNNMTANGTDGGGIGTIYLGDLLAPGRLVQPASDGTNFTFWFQTASNIQYSVQFNDDLRTTNWQFLETVTGNGLLQPCSIPMTNGPQRFFRVRQP